jgi:hypothetical protein
LTENRSQSATGQLPVKGDDHCPTRLATQLDMTALLADLSKPCPPQSTNHFSS